MIWFEKLVIQGELKSQGEMNVSNRIFGFLWCLIIGVYALLPLWRNEAIFVPAVVVAILLAMVAIAAPNLLAPPNQWWKNFCDTTNIVISNLVLFLIYFLFLTPGAVLLRMCGRNQLKLKIEPNACTYWTERPSGETDFTRPY